MEEVYPNKSVGEEAIIEGLDAADADARGRGEGELDDKIFPLKSVHQFDREFFSSRNSTFSMCDGVYNSTNVTPDGACKVCAGRFRVGRPEGGRFDGVFKAL